MGRASVRSVLAELDFSPARDDLVKIGAETKKIVESIRRSLKRDKKDADVFIGGSFAKRSLVRAERYEVDIFARFNKKYEKEDVSKLLERALKSSGLKASKIHGSRDYFKIKRGIYDFEIVPVLRITNPREARNVTDLSYFHVKYIKKKIKNERVVRDILLAKAFLHGQNSYGAESYINGFSGYATEVLVLHYGGFEGFIKKIINLKPNEVIDPEKHYKNSREALLEMNESKTHSPIVLVDPTFKERNILAALSKETLERVQESIKRFMKNPRDDYFYAKKINKTKLEERARKQGAEFIELEVKTDRQGGDIAGTKLKKFYNFVLNRVTENFDVLDSEFGYGERKSAKIYIVAKSKKEIVRKGPPIKLKKHVQRFKEVNKKNKVFAKKSSLYVRINLKGTLKEFLRNLIRDKIILRELSIVGLKVV